jgi:MerR family redox-sensitive transcriptional activator SoxR
LAEDVEFIACSFVGFPLFCIFKLALSQAPEELSIGEVARRAGVRTSAIRYYESIGLLPDPERVSGRRRYRAEILQTLSVIAAAQRASMSLDEVRELLAVSARKNGVSERLRAIAERKLPEVDVLIERAHAVREWLTAAADCRCPTLDDCPLFDEPHQTGPAWRRADRLAITSPGSPGSRSSSPSRRTTRLAVPLDRDRPVITIPRIEGSAASS